VATSCSPTLTKNFYKFKGDDTPLMQIALKAKRVKVTSPEVDHYMIDEPRTCVTTTAAVAKGTSNQFVVSLDGDDQQIPRPYGTLLAVGVDGYTEDGSKATPGKGLMLFVVGHDPATANPYLSRRERSQVNHRCRVLHYACHPSRNETHSARQRAL